MYFCAPCLARFFVLCQVYSSSRHLKNAPFAARLADLNPRPACVPRTSTRRTRHACGILSTPQQGGATPPALACGLWLVVSVSMFARSTRTP